MQARAPPGGSKRVHHLRHRTSLSSRPARPAHQSPHHRAMPGGQCSANPRAAAADDDPPPLDDVALERTALLRPATLSAPPSGTSIGSAAQQLRSHSAASFSIEGEGAGYEAHDADSLDGSVSDDDGDGAPQGSPPGVDVLAQLSLLGVAFIWGTYTPALRFLYQTPGPPSAAVLTGIRSTIQALTLVLPSLLVGAPRSARAESKRHCCQHCHRSLVSRHC